MKRIYDDPTPQGAKYIGSTEGPDRMSEAVADRLDEATDPAYIQDKDGTRHFFELCPDRRD